MQYVCKQPVTRQQLELSETGNCHVVVIGVTVYSSLANSQTSQWAEELLEALKLVSPCSGD